MKASLHEITLATDSMLVYYWCNNKKRIRLWWC